MIFHDNIIKVLGLDPGKTTGVAQITITDGKIRPTYFEECKDTTLLEIEHLFIDSDYIVVEDFRTRPGKARQGAFDWDQMIAPQVIGAAKLLAGQQKKTIHLQDSSLKPVAYGLSNQKYIPGKKGLHKQDALAHAVFYAVRNLHALPVRNVK